MNRFNRKQFFDAYRKVFGSLQQLQVDGLEFLLGKIEQDNKWESLPQIAYFLATVKHETGVSRNGVDQTFQPIRELRAKPGTKGRANQDRYWLSGYYGRGYVQITWKENYEKFGIAAKPDKALEPEMAYTIAARGMREGKFTKYKLSDFINFNEVDYHNARRVVNGLDRAELIAGHAQKFERVLKASLATGDKLAASELIEDLDSTQHKPTEPPVSSPPPDVVVTAEQPKETNPEEKAEVSGPKSWIAAATTFLTAAGGGIISWAQGASTPIIVSFFAAAAVVGTVYVISRYWYRNKENQRLAEVQLAREKMAHELTVLKIRSAMDKDANTVEIAH